jgi:hypothetical protein
MTDEELIFRLRRESYNHFGGTSADLAADRIEQLIAELKLCAVDMFEAEDKFHVLSDYISDPKALECAKSRVEWFAKANDRIQKVLNAV